MVSITCAVLDLVGIETTKSVISKAATNKYLKSSKPLVMNWVSNDKLPNGDSNSILGW